MVNRKTPHKMWTAPALTDGPRRGINHGRVDVSTSGLVAGGGDLLHRPDVPNRAGPWTKTGRLWRLCSIPRRSRWDTTQAPQSSGFSPASADHWNVRCRANVRLVVASSVHRRTTDRQHSPCTMQATWACTAETHRKRPAPAVSRPGVGSVF